MTRAELQALVEECRRAQDIASKVIVVAFTDEGGYGVVAYVRDEDYDPLVVHRWATKDTAGADRPFLLWSGGYYDHAEHWMLDFVDRSGRAALAGTAD